jgi:hypothetical protein
MKISMAAWRRNYSAQPGGWPIVLSAGISGGIGGNRNGWRLFSVISMKMWRGGWQWRSSIISNGSDNLKRL